METKNRALEPGNPETDFFYYNTPAEIHTWRAYDLFCAAEKEGLFSWICTNQAAVDFCLEDPCFSLRPNPAGPIKSLARLAYWCMRASYYLGLDRGKQHSTYWKPFEDLFGKKRRSLSRATWLLDLSTDERKRPISLNTEYTAEIDAFFDRLEADLNTDNNQ